MEEIDLEKHANELGMSVDLLKDILAINPNYINEERDREKYRLAQVAKFVEKERLLILELRKVGVLLSEITMPDSYSHLGPDDRLKLARHIGGDVNIARALLRGLSSGGRQENLAIEIIEQYKLSKSSDFRFEFYDPIEGVAHVRDVPTLMLLLNDESVSDLWPGILAAVIRLDKRNRRSILENILLSQPEDLHLIGSAFQLSIRFRVSIGKGIAQKYLKHADEDVRRMAKKKFSESVG